MIGETYEVAKDFNKAGYRWWGYDPHWDANVQRNDWDTWISARQVDAIPISLSPTPSSGRRWREAPAAGIKLISTNMTDVGGWRTYV